MGESENQGIGGKVNRTSAYQVNQPGFQRLWVWQKAHGLMLEVHQICRNLPLEQKFNRRSQLERSSASDADNIAEGHTSYYFNDKVKSFYVARKEAGETQNHIFALRDQQCLSNDRAMTLVARYEEVIRGINGYVRWIRTKKGATKV